MASATPAVVNIQTTQAVDLQQSPLFQDHASDIQVMLADKRVFKAKVVGTDPDTDVAVLKIEAKGLPTVAWGDSAALKVGHIVLVDIHGRLVGINTAIVSNGAAIGGGGGSVGIGFAIPSNTVKRILDCLLRTGKIERGYLGVSVGDLSDKPAREFRVPDVSGALVEDVTPGSPAARAGVKDGDVIRTLDGKTISSKDQLTFTVASETPGTVARLASHPAARSRAFPSRTSPRTSGSSSTSGRTRPASSSRGSTLRAPPRRADSSPET